MVKASNVFLSGSGCVAILEMATSASNLAVFQYGIGGNAATLDTSGDMVVPGTVSSGGRCSVAFFSNSAANATPSTPFTFQQSDWQPDFSNNTTMLDTSSTSIIDTNGFVVIPATGVWHLSFQTTFSAVQSGTTNQVWFMVQTANTVPALTPGQVYQRRGLVGGLLTYATATDTRSFAGGTAIAPVWCTDTQQTVGNIASSHLQLELVALLNS